MAYGKKLHLSLRRFREDRRGGILIMTAAAIFVLIVLIGGFTDFGTAMLARSQIHGSQDAAALAAAVSPVVKNANGEIDVEATQDAKKAVAERYYTANYEQGLGGSNVAPSDLTIAISDEGKSVTVSNSATVPTHFLPLADVNEVSIARTTVVGAEANTAKFQDVDMVLALDSSTSMRCRPDQDTNATDCYLSTLAPPRVESRSYAAQQASKTLISMLLPKPNPNVRFGLSEWGSRDAKNGGAVNLSGLSSDVAQVNGYINGISPDLGGTCASCGLQGAIDIFKGTPPPVTQRAEGSGEFSPVKAVILLTDGLFNHTLLSDNNGNIIASPYAGGDAAVKAAGYSAPPLKEARDKCDELKAPPYNATIYTIAFANEIGNAVSGPLYDTMRYCASINPVNSQPYFFSAPTVPDLQRAFEQITESISKVRITR